MVCPATIMEEQVAILSEIPDIYIIRIITYTPILHTYIIAMQVLEVVPLPEGMEVIQWKVVFVIALQVRAALAMAEAPIMVVAAVAGIMAVVRAGMPGAGAAHHMPILLMQLR